MSSIGRPRKTNLDYFPHETKHGQTIFILQSHYGNDGYAFWFKLLELVSDSENLVYDAENPTKWEYLLAYTGVDENTALDIMAVLENLGKIDKELWDKKLIWIPTLVKRVEKVFNKRKINIPQKPQLPDSEVSESDISDSESSINSISEAETTQSKVKQSKVNKKTYSQNSNEFRLSHLLLSLITKRRNTFKKPDLQKWCVHIDRMIKTDKREYNEIERIIRWCQQDDFWQNNILSTQKLREQFDKLALKMPKVQPRSQPESKPLSDEEIRENKRLSGLYDRMNLKRI